jgi:hypothetical protein
LEKDQVITGDENWVSGTTMRQCRRTWNGNILHVIAPTKSGYENKKIRTF